MVKPFRILGGIPGTIVPTYGRHRVRIYSDAHDAGSSCGLGNWGAADAADFGVLGHSPP